MFYAFAIILVAGQPFEPVCLDRADWLERHVSNVKWYNGLYEREGRITYEEAADIEYAIELKARGPIADLREMAFEPDMTPELCEAYFLEVGGPVVDMSNHYFSNIAAQRRKRLER